MNVQRLYDMAAKASAHAYPDILQQPVRADDVAEATGQGCWGRIRNKLRRLGRDKISLGIGNQSFALDLARPPGHLRFGMP